MERGWDIRRVRARNANLCRDDLFSCICMCNSPHARPPPGSRASGRTGQVGSVGAEPGRDRRLPALRPQMEHGERRGSSG